MVSYDNMWSIMKQRKMTETQLRIAAKLSSSTFAKLTHNKLVSLDILVRLCLVLNCQLRDICTIVKK